MHSVVDPIALLATLPKIALYLLALSGVIVIHELAHLGAARYFGVFVEEFAVGMGPKIWGFTSPKTGTRWSVRALPIGGYCAMRGEDKGKPGESSSPEDFRTKSPWQRLGIVVAGPIANLAFAYLLIFIGIGLFARQEMPVKPVIGTIIPHSPAARAGLHPGMRILSIGDQTINTPSTAIAAIHKRLRQPTDIVVLDGGAHRTVTVTPEPCPGRPELGCIGFVAAPVPEITGVYRWRFDQHPIQSRLEALLQMSTSTYGQLVQESFDSFAMLATHFQRYSGQVVGPIGMGQAAIAVQNFGWDVYFIFIGSISFIIGIANLLPIPGLDGGRLLFIVVELARRRPVNQAIEARIHIGGLIALLALMLIVGMHDIARIAAHRSVF